MRLTIFKVAMLISAGVGLVSALIRYALEIPTGPGSTLVSAAVLFGMAALYALDVER